MRRGGLQTGVVDGVEVGEPREMRGLKRLIE